MVSTCLVSGDFFSVLGLWSYEFGRRLVPWEMQPLVESTGGVDQRVLLFIAGTALFTGIGFGLAHAWKLSHANPNNALENTTRTVRTLFGQTRFSDLLVVAQMGAGADTPRRCRADDPEIAATLAGALRHQAGACPHAAGNAPDGGPVPLRSLQLLRFL